MTGGLRCPICETSVPDTGMSHNVGFETRQTAACPNCKAHLVRNPDSEVASLREWRPRDDSEPE